MSLSQPGIRASNISTTVIFEPRASYTVAISRPITPPPMTNKRLGISSSNKAPVESMIRGSSGKEGMLAG